MKKIHPLVSLLILLSLILGACTPTPVPAANTPTSGPKPPAPTNAAPTQPAEALGSVVISEVLAGVQGNNNYEFIELYNRGQQAVNLQGWSVWYRLAASTEDMFVYRWKTPALIPPQGHYLLGFEGQDLGLVADALYAQPLNTNGGGLELRSTDGARVDALGWGKAPEAFVEGTAAAALANGASLERLPGGEAGNAADTDDNSVDFAANPAPAPQNTGSPLAPLAEQRLEIQVQAPEIAEPGGGFEYAITITNRTGQDMHNLTVTLPLHAELSVTQLPENAEYAEGVFTWSLAELKAGESAATTLGVATPWSYLTAEAANYFVSAEDWPVSAYGGPVRTAVAGGVIPIGTARTLAGSELTVEGIATMYTGGYYAGGGNTKFYLQDETGGIQVQVFGGEGVVNVSVGARVRVRGAVEVYRGSVEIVPIVVPDDVQVIEPPSETLPAPIIASLDEAVNIEGDLPGKLVQVEGEVTRVEEFSFSYEIDLTSENGQTLILYVDKQTNLNVESIEPGQSLRAAGILDLRDTSVLLYPRLVQDLQEVFPPVLRLEVDGPITVISGEVVTYTLTAYNDTAETLTSVQVKTHLPAGGTLEEVLDGGQPEGESILWLIPSLDPGTSTALRFTVQSGAQDMISIENSAATAAELADWSTGQAIYTFVGETIPIWAIQGDGFRSAYVFETVTTAGVVTGVFPELGGFFIQETSSDDNPLTSPGLFITAGAEPAAVSPGDLVRVEGIVRESSQQTSIQISAPLSVTVVSPGTPLPAPAEVDPPETTAEAEVYFEALEGAYVAVTGPAVAVSPTSRYGEYVVVLAEHDVTRVYQGEDNGIMIMVDDGSDAAHQDRSTMAYVVAAGDEIRALAGPLAYTYGRYKIEPVAPPQIVAGAGLPPDLPVAGPDEFSIMTWNTENLFDPRDPHPSDPPKPRVAEYERDITKVANTIAAAGAPAIVALQEVENIDVLGDIAVHESLAGYGYEPYLIEGFDSRGIDVGYLVRTTQAHVIDVQQRDAPEGLTSRPPLVLEVEVVTTDGTATVYVINNHFTSMSGGEESTQERRTAQAAWNLTVVLEIMEEAGPDAYIAVVGDLNSYYESLPIDTLRAGGLQHVFEAWDDPTARPYTYIYQGESQVLDHIIVTPSLFGLIRSVQILHINADFPLPAPDDTSPWHKSDHDPVIVTFALPS